MTPYAFGCKLAEAKPGMQPGIQPLAQPISKPPKLPQPPSYNPAPDKLNLPSLWQTGGNMLSNASRVGYGSLAAGAGTLSAIPSGIAAGATNAWNAVTPKSMNTSPEWAGGINTAFNKSREFADAGWNDISGGLGGDTNYNQSKSWNVMQKGLADPNLDSTSRNIATTGAYGGAAAWNMAQAVPAGVTAARAIPAAIQSGKNLASTGMNLLKAPGQFIQNTFRPGFGELRNALRDTSRVYAQQPGSLLPYRSPTRTRAWTAKTPDAPYGRVPPPAAARNGVRSMSGDARLADTARSNAGGMYFGNRDVATSLFPRGTASGQQIMRHELTHGLQARTSVPNSLPGVIQHLRNSPGPWRQAAGHFLAEVNSNAAMARTVPQQMLNGLRFMADPGKAQYYSQYYAPYNFGRQYALLHGGAAVAPYAAGIAGLEAGRRALTNTSTPTNTPPATQFAGE